MDSWIRETALSDNQDLSISCFKMISWLSTEFYGALTYKEVETILICAAFVDIIVDISGEDFKNDLIKKYPHHKLFLKDFFRKLKEISVTQYSAAKILATEDGYKHVYTVESILKHFNVDISVVYNYKMPSRNVCTETPKYKMLVLVEKIFQLAPENIDIAVDRLFNCCDFSLLGYIFLEPLSSIHISKYKIIEHKICQKISDKNVNHSFIKSMYMTSANSVKGANFYKSCFENVVFGNSLTNFFIAYFNNFEKEDYYKSLNAQHKLSDIIFLVNCALSSKSSALSKLIESIRNNTTIKHLINKSFFNYN
ncbi:uncharacterized protein LOC101449845 [Ceratitis capitata]|uniref:Uncharacterized protein n=1 Tax=Ceratitis capitata TaxID=7213 RepID=W8C2J9_CERCA|nr:uncharacterized protein LOC101449845 [Ceratitis capitata]XP_004536769.1 uncharacterized protein LOC101449845 [Ceratitis capitata]XP_020717438.1 uncharacterized protein LOC101449845 [Ceratitis capitata]XP_020717439.1 uncharacterized protein LOC101449845 [Ceratitis capitata]